MRLSSFDRSASVHRDPPSAQPRPEASVRRLRVLDRPRSRSREGHRREVDPRRDRKTYQQRLDQAMLDVGIYRAISFRDLADARFDEHPYVARRAVDKLKRQGFLEEHVGRGPKGKAYRILTLTATGAEHARALASRHQLHPGQQIWSGLVKRSELTHEVAIYRAARNEAGQLLDGGARIKRIRLDAELKRKIAQKAETARLENGRLAADIARRQAARQLGLPVEDGKVVYPDAQIEYEDAEGRAGRVNIEVVTGDYRAAAIAAKARAGFALYASSGASARTGKALRGLGLDDRPGSIRGPADRGKASVEL